MDKNNNIVFTTPIMYESQQVQPSSIELDLNPYAQNVQHLRQRHYQQTSGNAPAIITGVTSTARETADAASQYVSDKVENAKRGLQNVELLVSEKAHEGADRIKATVQHAGNRVLESVVQSVQELKGYSGAQSQEDDNGPISEKDPSAEGTSTRDQSKYWSSLEKNKNKKETDKYYYEDEVKRMHKLQSKM